MYGLLASSKAQRLKPYAIDIRVDVNPVHWFLNGKEDTRSSYYLEDAATEFQVQGLELDWACVAWDGDLRFADSGWSYHHFRGDRCPQALVIVFGRQSIVAAAFNDLFGDGILATHRVDRHQGSVQIQQLKELGNGRDRQRIIIQP